MPESARLTDRLLRAFAGFVCKRALWIVIAALILAAGSVVLALTRLTFITDRNELVSPEAEFNKRFLRFRDAFGDQELMLLFIAPAPGPVDNPGYSPDAPSAATREEMKAAAHAIAEKLRARPELFPAVIERADPEKFGGTRMLYLPQQDLERVAAQIQSSGPLLAAVAKDPGVPGFLTGLRDNIEQGNVATTPDPATLNEGGRGLAQLLAAMRAGIESAQGEAALSGGMFSLESSNPELDRDGYFFSWEGRLLFVPLLPAKNQTALDQVQQPIAFARAVVAEVRKDHPALAIGISGRPAIYSDEMASTNRDMTNATIFSLIGVGLLFIVMFRSVVRPLLAVLTLVMAIIWTVGATTLLIGHLNIFAMVFGVVLVGLGIDFGIHVLNHYRYGLARGLSVREALADTYGEIGMGTFTGAATTAAALATAVFTDFRGLSELGIICGVGIMLCLIGMLVVFPAMLVLFDRKRLDHGDDELRETMRARDIREAENPEAMPAGTGIARYAARAVAIMVAAGAAIAIFAATRGWVPFDYNLLEINDPSSAAVQWERLLIQHDQRASYAVSIQKDVGELRRVQARMLELKEKGVVRDVESMFPVEEEDKRRTLAAMWRVLPENFAQAPATPGDAASVRKAARRLQAALRELVARGEAFAAAFNPAADEAGKLVELCDKDAVKVDSRLKEFEPRFFGALRKAIIDLRRDALPPPITADSMPEILRGRYVGTDKDGTAAYALYVYPAQNIWIHELAGQFNTEVRKIDPQITGVTIQIHEAAELIVSGFTKSVIYAFIAIMFLIFLDLRRPLALSVSMLPLLGGLAILAGIMALTGLKFNFANFFAVPILIGTTVDAGVYLVHCQRHGSPARQLRQTRMACVLCGMTTFLGFGTLAFAAHKGVISLGLILAAGTLASLAVSFFLVPAILSWFNKNNVRL
ncbi:MAG: MMPL family transporter [Planctomycetes bacterium]|nr:MMPL family transporter [Planctomycetota bacterium]